MKYALIGCGRIAPNHIKAAVNNRLDILAVCDPLPEKMEALIAGLEEKERSRVRLFPDYRAMLSAVRPDLAAIATESGLHGEIALNCLDAGVNLIIEKPITLDLAQADLIIARAEARGLKVCACHQNRFNVAVQHLRRAVEQGRFGRLSHGCVHVRWNRDEAYYRQAPWRGTWAQDGGALMNQSIHGLDLLRWLMGDEIEEVFAYTARRFHPYLEGEDVGLGVIKFRDGGLGTLEGTTNVFPRNLEETLYLFGRDGTAKIGGQSANTIEQWLFRDERPEDELLRAGLREEAANVYGHGHSRLYADVIEAVERDRPPYVDGRAGRRALELVLAVYRSSAEGRAVRLPLAEGSSLDFAGLFDGPERRPS